MKKLSTTFLNRIFNRSITTKVPAQLYEGKKWITKDLTFHNLPKDETIQNKTRFDFDKSHLPPVNIYSSNLEFKNRLDQAMQTVYNTKVTAKTKFEAENQFITWKKLRDYIYLALNNEELTNGKMGLDISYRDILMPSNPNFLIKHLLQINKIEDPIWKMMCQNKLLAGNLKIGNEITILNKYVHLLSRTFDYIYEQEVLIRTTPSYDSIQTNTKELNLLNPAEWFPETRKMRRNIIMHIGPTNSGKTYKALQRLQQAESGYYAGPLRLLAREIYDRFKTQGIKCNLLTGEEIIQNLNEIGTPAGLTSGTVEMVSMSKLYDVVVLDEIQMMADNERGWAWTNALLGVRANELHLCGEKSALPIIKKIVQTTGDNLIVNEYDRLGALVVESKPVSRRLKGLRKGDCVVAFSKKKILDLKLKIEKETDLKVGVIYGSLPPETRVQQAQLFNDGEYDVLVASDAIGMGLNLSIDRVIFTTDLKFNGTDMIELSSSNIKQIGGRAGRYKHSNEGEELPIGKVTSFHADVLPTIKAGMEAPIEYIKSATIWPTDEICSRLMTQFPPNTSLSEILELIASQLEKNSNKVYKLSDLRNKLSAIRIFEHMEDIPFEEKLRLSNAPIKDVPLVKKAFSDFCTTIGKRQTKGLLSYNLPFDIVKYKLISNEKFNLEMYEALYNIVTLYSWLANRYPNYFIDIESAKNLRVFIELIIFEKLDRLRKNPYDHTIKNSNKKIKYKVHNRGTDLNVQRKEY